MQTPQSDSLKENALYYSVHQNIIESFQSFEQCNFEGQQNHVQSYGQDSKIQLS